MPPCVVNSTLSDTYDMDVTAEVSWVRPETAVYKISLARCGSGQQFAGCDRHSGFRLEHGAQFYFVRLSIGKGDGVTVSRNFYWVPSQLTVFDWPKTTYINSPAKTAGVMTDLRKLRPAM